MSYRPLKLGVRGGRRRQVRWDDWQRLSQQDRGGCNKKPFAMQPDAEAWAKRHEKRHGRQRAYLCPCGYWHLTRQ